MKYTTYYAILMQLHGKDQYVCLVGKPFDFVYLDAKNVDFDNRNILFFQTKEEARKYMKEQGWKEGEVFKIIPIGRSQ